MFEPIDVSLFEDVTDYYYFQANVNYKYSQPQHTLVLELCGNIADTFYLHHPKMIQMT
jgi:hypothetical protein